MSYFREIRRVLKPTGRFISTFFLLTSESRANLVNSKKTPALTFPHDFGTYRVLNANDPAAAVAYDEAWIRRTLSDVGLRLCKVAYGSWSGERDYAAIPARHHLGSPELARCALAVVDVRWLITPFCRLLVVQAC
jgi:hypothetical protein